MLLFAALILRGYWIALHTRDRFGTLLVVGFTTQLAVQVFLNIGVVTGLLPTTGISLPFFSYGGIFRPADTFSELLVLKMLDFNGAGHPSWVSRAHPSLPFS